MKSACFFIALVAQVMSQGVPFFSNNYQNAQVRPQSVQYQFQPMQQQVTQQQQIPQIHSDAIQVNNDQLLAIAAANGLDVEAIRQNLLAGRPVEIELNQINQQTPRPKPQQQAPQKSPLNTPAGIFTSYQNLINTAADPRIKQMLQTQDFEQWHKKLIQSNPNVVGIRHAAQKV